MNWLKRILGDAIAWLKRYFSSGQAQADMKWALEHLPQAMPYIKTAMAIIAGLTPTPVDDLVWAAVIRKYPSFFDGTLTTLDELKAAALVAAAELFKAAFPKISTTVARVAVQMAYVEYKGGLDEDAA